MAAGRRRGALAYYRRAGWDTAALESYRPAGRLMTPLPASYRRITDGEILRIGAHAWRVVTGSGHTPEHACLYCEELGLLISGDQVLPEISSNVSVLPREPAADPLADWLASLAKLKRKVPDSVLVLPSHGAPFKPLHARLDALAQRRTHALQRLRAQLAQAPCRPVDSFLSLFRRVGFDDPFVRMLATGEAVAYLNHLLARGEATVRDDSCGQAWYALARSGTPSEGGPWHC